MEQSGSSLTKMQVDDGTKEVNKFNLISSLMREILLIIITRN